MDIKRPAKEDTGKLSLLALLMYRSATSGGKFTAIRFSLRFIFAPVGAALEHTALRVRIVPESYNPFGRYGLKIYHMFINNTNSAIIHFSKQITLFKA